MRISRRHVLAGVAAGALAPRIVRAQTAQPFNILGHRVHQLVATEASRPGGDVTAEWQARNNRRLVWATFDVTPIHDRLQRELSLGETSFNMAYVLNTALNARVMRQLEPLDPLQAAEPIEAFDDISPGMVRATKLDGSLRLIPVRHATVGLFYNEEILAERGITKPPETLEELVETAHRCTYTRADGTPVNGFTMPGNSHFNLLSLAFGYDAPLIDQELRLLPNEAGFERMFAILREMFQRGTLPRNWPGLPQEETFTQIQQGRAAMVYSLFGRYQDFNDPQRSRVAGKIKVVPAVASASVRERVPVVATSEFWSLAIPRNGTDKQLAWSLIRTLSSRDGTLRQALNGNGPIRASAYADPRFIAMTPYAATEARVLPYARPPMPAFDRTQEAIDMLIQDGQAVAIGRLSPAEAVADLKRRIAPLLRAN
jgi:multiple sugar transport system substrate-binding protein